MTKPKQIKVGDVFVTNEGGSVSVVEYRGSREVLIKHNDKYGHVAAVRAVQLRNGQVKNPYHPAVQSIGFIGTGRHTTQEAGKDTPAYKSWCRMLERCYSPKYLTKRPTYHGCTVHPDWHNYQNFAEWFGQQLRATGWHLDKDLIEEGNKVYSVNTCAFVPHQLNSLLLDNRTTRGELPQGVLKHHNRFRAILSVDDKNYCLGVHATPEEAFIHYKLAKEYNVKRMAEQYRHLIDHRVYIALMRYEVKL